MNGVRVMLILGPTGTGKSVHGNQMLSLEQKYDGFTYIFDIGGSYESVVELYGGRVDKVGKDGPRVNLFALEPTESNLKFLYSFVKLLLTNGGAAPTPGDDDMIFKEVQNIYPAGRCEPSTVEPLPALRSQISIGSFRNSCSRSIIAVRVQKASPLPRTDGRKVPFCRACRESLEQLDLLLIHELRSRRVRNDGIHFHSFRYLSLTLAAYVGEDVPFDTTRETWAKSWSSIMTGSSAVLSPLILPARRWHCGTSFERAPTLPGVALDCEE